MESSRILGKIDSLLKFLDKPLPTKSSPVSVTSVRKVATATKASNVSTAATAAWTKRRERQLEVLKSNGIVPTRETNPDLTVKKPVGHTTHNLFVKCKKKKTLFLITHRQQFEADLKQLSKQIPGAKELRLARNPKDSIVDAGCITCLTLLNEVEGKVTWVVDKELMNTPEWVICAGCDDPLDHSQHNVVTMPKDLVFKLCSEGREVVQLEMK